MCACVCVCVCGRGGGGCLGAAKGVGDKRIRTADLQVLHCVVYESDALTRLCYVPLLHPIRGCWLIGWVCMGEELRHPHHRRAAGVTFICNYVACAQRPKIRFQPNPNKNKISTKPKRPNQPTKNWWGRRRRPSNHQRKSHPANELEHPIAHRCAQQPTSNPRRSAARDPHIGAFSILETILARQVELRRGAPARGGGPAGFSRHLCDGHRPLLARAGATLARASNRF